MRPGLAKNECLSRHPAGARLLQIGEQSLAMGLKFRARVVLDIEEHPTGLAEDLIDDLVSCCFEIRFAGYYQQTIVLCATAQLLVPSSGAASSEPVDPTLSEAGRDLRGAWCAGAQAVDEGQFPGPRSPASEGDTHDISFALQAGDFQVLSKLGQTYSFDSSDRVQCAACGCVHSVMTHHVQVDYCMAASAVGIALLSISN